MTPGVQKYSLTIKFSKSFRFRGEKMRFDERTPNPVSKFKFYDIWPPSEPKNSQKLTELGILPVFESFGANNSRVMRSNLTFLAVWHFCQKSAKMMHARRTW